MKPPGIFICWLFTVSTISCKSRNVSVCDCLADWEIAQTSPAEVEPVSTCLNDLDVKLTSKNNETTTLINELDPICPQEARKLFKLCLDIDQGVVVIR